MKKQFSIRLDIRQIEWLEAKAGPYRNRTQALAEVIGNAMEAEKKGRKTEAQK